VINANARRSRRHGVKFTEAATLAYPFLDTTVHTMGSCCCYCWWLSECKRRHSSSSATQANSNTMYTPNAPSPPPTPAIIKACLML
jgi:hypothetical protein